MNGIPKDAKIFPRVTGYVEQMDIHDPHCTVREGLTFSAKLVRDRFQCDRVAFTVCYGVMISLM